MGCPGWAGGLQDLVARKWKLECCKKKGEQRQKELRVDRQGGKEGSMGSPLNAQPQSSASSNTHHSLQTAAQDTVISRQEENARKRSGNYGNASPAFQQTPPETPPRGCFVSIGWE